CGAVPPSCMDGKIWHLSLPLDSAAILSHHGCTTFLWPVADVGTGWCTFNTTSCAWTDDTSTTIAAAAITRNMGRSLLRMIAIDVDAPAGSVLRRAARLQRALALQPLPQALQQPPHRLTAVADLIFLVKAQF